MNRGRGGLYYCASESWNCQSISVWEACICCKFRVNCSQQFKLLHFMQGSQNA